jgi:hypothetical protein
MKIQEDKVGVSLGNEGEVKFGFAENASFLTDALIKLYSKPRHAILRELVSNAYDATVDLDETAEKRALVIITPKNVIIQDFGTGMSPEFMKDGYTKMGFSTKRDNEKAIGGFGLGRISVLSYVKTYTIETVYEGIKSKYLIYKDTSINIDFLCEKPAEEGEIGTRVEFAIKDDQSIWFTTAKEELAFFDKTQIIVLDSDQKQVNSYNPKPVKIKVGESEFFFTDKSQMSVVYGKVNYPISFSELPKVFRNGDVSIMLNMALYVPISEGLPVTPSRENFEYTKSTIDFLTQKINDFFEVFNVKYEEEYQNANLIEKAYLIENNNFSTTFNKVLEPEGSEISVTVPKKYLQLKSEKPALKTSYLKNIENFVVELKSSKVRRYSVNYSKSFLVNSQDFKFKPGFKDYLSKNYPNHICLRKKLWSEVFDRFGDFHGAYKFSSQEDRFQALQEFLDAQDIYTKYITPIEKVVEEFDNYKNSLTKKQKDVGGLKYFRVPTRGDSVRVSDQFIQEINDKNLKFIEKKARVLFYNTSEDDFKFITSISTSFNADYYCLNLKKNESELLESIKYKMVDMQNIAESDPNNLKLLYTTAIVQSLKLPGLNSYQTRVLASISNDLHEKFLIVSKYVINPKVPELYLDSIIEVCKKSGVTLLHYEEISEISKFKDAINLMSLADSGNTIEQTNVLKNSFVKLLVLTRQLHLVKDIDCLDSLKEILVDKVAEKEIQKLVEEKIEILSKKSLNEEYSEVSENQEEITSEVLEVQTV